MITLRPNGSQPIAEWIDSAGLIRRQQLPGTVCDGYYPECMLFIYNDELYGLVDHNVLGTFSVWKMGDKLSRLLTRGSCLGFPPRYIIRAKYTSHGDLIYIGYDRPVTITITESGPILEIIGQGTLPLVDSVPFSGRWSPITYVDICDIIKSCRKALPVSDYGWRMQSVWGNLLLITGDERYLVQWCMRAGQIVWKADISAKVSATYLAENVIMYCTGDGTRTVINTADGSEYNISG